MSKGTLYLIMYEHFGSPLHDSGLDYVGVNLAWPIASPLFPVALSCLLVQVDELVEMSLGNAYSHLPILGSIIGTYTPKKWDEDFEDPLANAADR